MTILLERPLTAAELVPTSPPGWARIPQYACLMADTGRVTVTLPLEQIEWVRQRTDNISAFVAEAIAAQIRHESRHKYVEDHKARFGDFSEETRATARARAAKLLRGSNGGDE